MIFELQDVEYAYPVSPEPVLSGASLTLAEGEILTILGPNGSGKTTLMGVMLGHLRPRRGDVRLCGQDVKSLGARKIAALASYVRQTQLATFAYTVAEYVLMGRAPMLGALSRPGKADREAAERAMEELGIAPLARKSINELSGGERQQAMIARAIVSEPRAILMDEPTAHLDYGNQLRALRLIKRLSEAGYAIAVTTHNPDHALLLGGSVALLTRGGSLKTGGAAELLQEDILSEVYGAGLRLCYQPEVGRVACIYPNL